MYNKLYLIQILIHKLTDYLLSESHSVGKSKAKFFRELGFSRENVAILEQELIKYRDHLEDLVNSRTLELKTSEEKYRSMISNLDEGFYSVTIQGLLLDHNKRFNEILGFDLSKDQRGVQLPDFWQNPADRGRCP